MLDFLQNMFQGGGNNAAPMAPMMGMQPPQAPVAQPPAPPTDAAQQFIKSLSGGGNTDYAKLLEALTGKAETPKGFFDVDTKDKGDRMSRFGRELVKNSKGKGFLDSLLDASTSYNDGLDAEAEKAAAQKKDAVKTVYDVADKDRGYKLNTDKFGFEKEKTGKELAQKDSEIGIDQMYKSGMLGNAAGQLNLARDKMGQTDATSLMDYMVNSGIAKDKKEAYGLYAKMHQTAGANALDPIAKAKLEAYNSSIKSALTPSQAKTPEQSNADVYRVLGLPNPDAQQTGGAPTAQQGSGAPTRENALAILIQNGATPEQAQRIMAKRGY